MSNTNQHLYHLFRDSTDKNVVRDAINELVKSDPKIYLYERAMFHSDEKSFDLALNDLNALIEVDLIEGLSGRALFLLVHGSREAALADYELVIDFLQKQLVNAQGPERRDIERKLGAIFFHRGYYFSEINEISLANHDFKRATYLDPSWRYIYVDFCEKNSLEKDYEECLNLMINLKDRIALIRRAKLFEKQSNYASAENDYNMAVSSFPRVGLKDAYSPKAWALLCRSHFYRRQGRLVKAARDNFYSNLHVVLQIPLSNECWSFYKSHLV
jgi:tetratricopeptide (TPR) repeat protein